jgi:lipid II:glycine glycyltransferase (peptidoglycan interpeptide bridge formation enzyme)
MEIKEILEKNIWEEFLQNCQEKTFLQSWNWGEFQKEQSGKIWRFGIWENNDLVSIAMAIKISAKRGTFLFVPHGPVVRTTGLDGGAGILEILLEKLKEIAKQEKADFIRISPLFLKNLENKKIFRDLGFRVSPMHSSAYEATWKLDISLPEEKLLANMRKTTRYLIKKVAENKDISIEISFDPKDIEIYHKLNREVAERQRFVPFSDEFIKKEFEIFSKDRQSVFIFGKYKGQVVAGALIIFWPASPAGGQEIAFYHQAGSLGEFSKLSVPYLLQWQTILEAKRRGCKVYDFWGFTDPSKFPRHPWAGPTLFKMGFGGQKYEYVKTQDYIISWKYWINYIIEKIRKIKRGL